MTKSFNFWIFLAFDVNFYVKIFHCTDFEKKKYFLLDFQTETALIYDAVTLFARALTDLDRSQDVQPEPIDCTGRDTWVHGNSLVNFMKMVRQYKSIIHCDALSSSVPLQWTYCMSAFHCRLKWMV